MAHLGLLRAAIGASLAVAAVIIVGNGGSGERTLRGDPVKVGEGTAHMFVSVAANGAPRAIGIALSSAALRGLPSRMNNTSRCFDKDGDKHLAHGECLGDYQTTLMLPNEASTYKLPARWATLNWNPEGHMHPAPPVWSAPHFDFHFYIAEPQVIEAIQPGGCGEIIDCEDFAAARLPLPAEQHPADYIDVGAAVAAMGNHLVDSKDPELLDPSLGFTRTFIYGVFAGRVTFLEPMVSYAYLAARPDACTPIKQPQAWASSAYYPTQYCVRYDAATEMYRVTLEGLVLREAGDAGRSKATRATAR